MTCQPVDFRAHTHYCYRYRHHGVALPALGLLTLPSDASGRIGRQTLFLDNSTVFLPSNHGTGWYPIGTNVCHFATPHHSLGTDDKVMALNVANIKAGKTKAPIENRRGGTARDLGPNPFLDAKWDYNLANSFAKGEAYFIILAGTYVDTPYAKGERKGEIYQKLTGDAADGVSLLRKAAVALEIGVAIREYTGKGPDGQAIPKGNVLIQYAGQKAKQNKPKPESVPAVNPDAPVADPAANGNAVGVPA